MIEIRNLRKSFGDKAVLKDISLTIHDGETFAVIGRSGTGKSVLLKHIIRLLEPDGGEIFIDGTDINTLPYIELRKVRRQFGVLFQGGALFDSMTVYENVAFPLRTFTEMTEKEIEYRVQECLEDVMMPDAGHKRPAEISGGMQKRVALARAIALEPRYILYDEPTSGLDPETSNTIDELIKKLGDKMNITSIVITHDMHSVLSVADRAALLYEGNVQWVGTIDEMHRSDDQILRNFVKANEYKIGI